MNHNALAGFSAPTREWFSGAFEEPTSAQRGAWHAIASGDHALVVAPTGSGKTLAAFLSAVDSLLSTPRPADPVRRCRVLYVSPLKALAADVERNLRSPLTGIGHAAARLGAAVPDVTVSMRTGDTPAAERRAFATRPSDILITTPESLFLVLTSAARDGLSGIETVIVDEVHAVAGSKRGAHLALSLERLDAMLERPAQRIGLSATVDPVEPVARFLAGARAPQDGGRHTSVVQPGGGRRPAVDVVVPVPDLRDLPPAPPAATTDAGDGTPTEATASRSVWPHVEERIVDLIERNRSTIVFTNARRGAERLTARINEVAAGRAGGVMDRPGDVAPAAVPGQSGSSVGAPAVMARAHHGSISRTERTQTESDLKAGVLPAVVATSSLELGIDMGAVDLVVQVGAPPSVASGLQRIGRAGHQVGAQSHGVIVPTFRGELVPATVVAARMAEGAVEAIDPPRTPLDVLAQHIVAAVALDAWTVQDLATLVRRATPFADLGDATWTGVLDMLAGRYPSEDFGELRPRIVWDRSNDTLSARPGAQRLAVTSGGTIPDRGQYGVFLAGDDGLRGSRRVGELDEEMVYESRVGDTFTLGSSTWRIEDITPDRVLVSPAPGIPGRLPFWKGDSPGRPAELGGAIGAWLRGAATRTEDPGLRTQLTETGLDRWASDNLLSYLTDQAAATGVLPDDRTIVVERFRDELGDWRVVIHSPWGARVHAPWALALTARLRERLGVDVAAMPADDGIVLRVPDTGAAWDAAFTGGDTGPRLTAEDLIIEPDSLRQEVRDALGGSVLFAARFREAASRALLLPRRGPDRRSPLWQQRRRASQLLEVAARYPEFPIVLEAVRECLQDDFDVPALERLLRSLADGTVRLVDVTTPHPSPFASTLLVGYTAQFLYDGDAPLAERRAAALTLDPAVLAELLGPDAATQLADLLDVEAVERTESELTGVAPTRQARDIEGLWDVLRRHGPLRQDEIESRLVPEVRDQAAGWLDDLRQAGRAIDVRISGTTDPQAWATVEDAGRLRDALGVALPGGIPDAHLAPVDDPLGDLVRHHARTHAPFPVQDIAVRFGLASAVMLEVLRRLEREHLLTSGALRPESMGGTGEEWSDPDVLRMLRRRSLAALRAEVEPVEEHALGLFAPRWHGVGTLRGTSGVFQVVEQLSGLPLPASVWESQILPARVVDYAPRMLDELTTSGDVLWVGHRPLPGPGDGMVSLHVADAAPLTLPPAPEDDASEELDELARTLLALLGGSGGYFLSQLTESTGRSSTDVLAALWDLVWRGLVTNDGFGALRDRLGSTRPRARASSPRGSRRFGSLGAAPRREAPPGGQGRWSAVPAPETDPARRTAALTRVLLDRHGVLTRGSARAEGVTDYFRGIYRALGELENHGAVRRGYFVEHLGAAQFALPGAVDRLRVGSEQDATGTQASRSVVVLAASDPANPYGAALAWPAPRGGEARRLHRGAGALVVLRDGVPAVFVGRGGRSMVTFGDGPATTTDDVAAWAPVAQALVDAVRAGFVESLTVTTVDDDEALAASGLRTRTGVIQALLDAGFRTTPRGLRLRRS